MKIIKDPEAILDYPFDWKPATNGRGGKDWLADGETIVSHTITVPTGLTLDSSSESDGIVVAWLSGGTADMTYRVECKITTNMGRTDERSIWITVRER